MEPDQMSGALVLDPALVLVPDPRSGVPEVRSEAEMNPTSKYRALLGSGS
jgi:hypothetical protein